MTLTIRAGCTHRGIGGSLHSLSEIIIHPLYDYRNIDYDAALLFVTTNFKFDSTRQPIDICSDEPKSGNLTVSGWGFLTVSI